MFELFIAERYLRAKRKQVMISVITIISVIGVAAGVMALVIALAITNGFRNTVQRSLLAATAHVMILEKTRGEGVLGWQEVAAKLAQLPGVTSVTPALYDFASISGPVNSVGVQIKGISVQAEAALPDTLVRLKEGSLEGLRNPDGLPGILLGERLAAQIGAVVGKPVNLTIVNGEITPFGPRPSVETVRVAGIFESGVFELDNGWAFMRLADVQQLWGYRDIVNSIELRLADIYQAEQVARAAGPLIGPDLAATTWQEQNRHILDAFRLERIVTVVTIGLIQLVAALNILITLVMMVMEKHRDIAILMSMGARAAQIRKIFLLQGAIIGGTGTVIGLILGYGISFLADRYRWLTLDQEVYSLKYVPLESSWVDGVWIAAAAMTVSLLATLYPASSATRISPVESMRYE